MPRVQKKKSDGTEPLNNKNRELFSRLYAGNKFGKCFGNATQSYLIAYGGGEEIEKNLSKIVIEDQKRAAAHKAGKTVEWKAALAEIRRLEERNITIKKTASSNGEILLRNTEVLLRIDFLFDQYLDPDKADREMAYVIAQRDDLLAKVSAYREVAKVRGRVNEKLSGTLNIRWDDPESGETTPKIKNKSKKEVAKKVVEQIKVEFQS